LSENIYLPSDLKIAFIVHNLRCTQKYAGEIAEQCNKLSNVKDIELFYTKEKKDGEYLAHNAVNQNFNCIIGIGGDGTFHEIVNAVLPEQKEGTAVGIIPAGTGNDFYTAHFGKFKISAFLNAIAEQKIRKTDVGEVSTRDIRRFFVNAADVGFGAHTVKLLEQQRKAGLGGGISYTLAILRAFATYKKPTIKINSDSLHYHGEPMMIAVCNGPSLGNGLRICPEARSDDGILHGCIIDNVSVIDYLKNYNKLKKGIKILHPEIRYFSEAKIMIGTYGKVTDFELDGELYQGADPAFSIIPSALNLLCPD
jgi:YegS/Rv2252/BmrU family lipid kinase